MLTKEKLSEITKQAIGTFHYTYAVAKVSSQNSFAIRLYDQLNEELVFMKAISRAGSRLISCQNEATRLIV